VRGELQRGHAGVDAYRVLQLQQLGSWQFGNVFCHHTGGEILYGKAIIYGSNSWFCSLQLLQYYVEIRETQEL